MRVIAGEAKGCPLKWPRRSNIRPTTDLMKEAIFSALQSLTVDWSNTLDLYAGTGALGIEALSRGADKADFVEKNPKCCAVIKENLERTGLDARARVHRLAVERALDSLEAQYDLVLMDPPYYDQSGMLALEKVAVGHLVGKQSTIVMEHSPKMKLQETYGAFQLVRNLDHGDSSVSIFQVTERRN